MKKRFLIIAGLGLACAFNADRAWSQAAFDKGYSTWTVVGVFCTTGTRVQLNATRQLPGFLIGGYRVNNLDGADTLYVGHDRSVSTNTASAIALARLGERVVSGGSATYELGLNQDLADQPDVELWCMAVDAAGAAAALVNLVTFGYK